MYILRVSNKAFIQVKPDEVVVTSNYEKATVYNKIGEAMRIASELNNDFENFVVKVISIK